MATINNFEDIEAWQAARDLARGIYLLLPSHPAKRDFGFRDQLCRACVSTMSNIAEAFGRSTDLDKARFLDFAKGSGNESLSMLLLGRDIGYFTVDEFVEFEEHNREALAKVTVLLKYLRPYEKRDV